MENIPMDKNMLAQWLKSGFIENSLLYATEAGTPQGGIISPR
jgi:RNA-directed DNA polymerase